MAVEAFLKQTLTARYPEYGFWDMIGLGDEPEYIFVEEERTYITTNNDFGWNKDKYTMAIFDILNIDKDIEGDIESASLVVVGRPLNLTLSEAEGSSNKKNNSFLISDDLVPASENTYRNKVSFGGVAIHEMVAHFHPLGGKELSKPLKNHFGIPAGDMDHPGGPKLNFSESEKQRLEKLRSKTGSENGKKDKK